MEKIKVPIKDSLFSHAKTSSFWNDSDYIEWNRNDDNVKDYIFLTDLDVQNFNLFPNKKIYAWLLESPEITPKAYEFVKLNNTLFDKIFTFDEDILKLENSFFLPFGGSMLDQSDIKIFDKNKNISMMFSWKRNLAGHTLRHNIYNNFKNKIDFYGSGVNGINVKKINSLKDYKFSVIVENCKKNHYFTEKIIDCFLTGTIPIYWGCPSIGDFFDLNGILVFNDKNELSKILESLNGDTYNKMYKSLNNNFNEAKKYAIAEDYLYKNYKNLLT
jgi:hypothetical protein